MESKLGQPNRITFKDLMERVVNNWMVDKVDCEFLCNLIISSLEVLSDLWPSRQQVPHSTYTQTRSKANDWILIMNAWIELDTDNII